MIPFDLNINIARLEKQIKALNTSLLKASHPTILMVPIKIPQKEVERVMKQKLKIKQRGLGWVIYGT